MRRVAEAEGESIYAEGESIYLEPAQELGSYPTTLVESLQHWAAVAPERPFLSERDPSGEWQAITYRQFHSSVRNVAQALLNRNLSPANPIVILSGNSISHAILGMAAMYIGQPYAPLSPAYLRPLEQLSPQLVFASDAAPYLPAPCLGNPTIERITDCSFHDLVETPATKAVDLANSKVDPDTIAKILFTSGSTARPKGVINTQRMLASNQQMIASAMPMLHTGPPVLCDWLPWHHTFGGNHNFGLVLYNGGILYIDRGRPSSAAIETTLRNLREIAPTIYFNVPVGFDYLLEALRKDCKLSQNFFSRLQLMFCAGAGLSAPTWEAMERAARRSSGRSIPMLSGFGSTETSPMALFADERISQPRIVGLPVAGVRAKLASVGGKLELRVKGPNVTPGYWKNEQLTALSFDSEGFYKTGDAVRFADPEDPSSGLVFDGRLGLDFKLSSGTLVDVESLKTKILSHCAPLIQDVVLIGQDQDEITALIALEQNARNTPGIRDSLKRALQSFAAKEPGTSRRIARAAILPVPLSQHRGEITDKGVTNQMAVLQNYAGLVIDLSTKPLPEHIITL